MTLIYFIINILPEILREREEQKRAQYLEMHRKLQRERDYDKFKLTCRGCGRLALPIPGTNNRYSCQHCGHRFAAAKHGY